MAPGVNLQMNSSLPASAGRLGKNPGGAVKSPSATAIAALSLVGAYALLSSDLAWAQTTPPPTASGTEIAHALTATYKIGSIDQNPVTDSVKYIVDRVIQYEVVSAMDVQTHRAVLPGSTAQPMAFKVHNHSNAPMDIKLEVHQYSTGYDIGAATTDAFDVASPVIYYDSNNNRVFEPGTDKLSHVDELPAGGTGYFWVFANIPSNLNNGQVSGILINSIAHEPGTSGTLGAKIAPKANAGRYGMDTIFRELASLDDPRYDGTFTNRDYYQVSAPDLVYKWHRTILSDGKGSAIPKLIPGADVFLCLTVTNSTGAAKAQNLKVAHPFPPELSFTSTYGVKAGGSTSGSTSCSITGAIEGTIEKDAAGNVTKINGTLGDIDPGQTKSLAYQAKIK